MTCRCPRRSADRADVQRTELVERERAIRVVFEHVLDAVQLGVTVRVVGLLPRLRSLERDVVVDQDLTATLPADLHDPFGIVGEVVDEFADRPPGERLTQCFRSLAGRRDDEVHIVSRDLAGTATRPLRVQRSHPLFVEPVDHLADPILRRRDESGDHRHRVPTRRRLNHQGASPLHDRLVGAAPTASHDPLDLAAFFVREATDSQRLCHPTRKTDPAIKVVDATHQRSWSGH